MLEETVAVAAREKQVTRKELSQVNVDTTVQEKNVTHPTFRGCSAHLRMR
jgi:hypothetical protein